MTERSKFEEQNAEKKLKIGNEKHQPNLKKIDN